MVLVYLSIAWAAGILLGSTFHLPSWSPALGLIPLALLIPFRNRLKLVAVVCACLVLFCGGAVRYQTSLPREAGGIASYNDGGAVTLKGIVATAPDVRDTHTRLTVSVTGISTGGEQHEVSGRVMIFASRYPEYEYGDSLDISGVLETPESSGDFDYKGYLAGQGISSVMYYPRIEVTGHGGGFKPLAWVYRARQALAATMAQVLPEPQAALAQGIVLGMRASIPPSVNEDFVRTGTAHILAISGQNLSIVAGMFIAAGIWLFGKRHYRYVWLALAATWAYALLTGLSAPVVRSAIMLSLFLWADLLGRQRSVLPALALAGGVMLGLTPRLLWDASSQLSFLSMLGLVLVAVPLQSFARDVISTRLGEESVLVSGLNWVSDSLAVTVGVILVIWPVIAHYFGVFSIVAPLANLLILPVLPAIMATSALASVLGLIALPLGQAMGWLAWFFNSYLLAVTHGLAGLPAASVTTGAISPAWMWSYFAALALVLWLLRVRKRVVVIAGRVADFLAGPSKRYVLPCLAVLSVLSILFAVNMPDDRTHVSFLDVGQGDAILIRKGQQEILIDGGPDATAVIRELSRRMSFWDRTIELVVLTHPHADHIAGLIEVLKRYHVERVLYTESTSTSPLWTEWLELVKDRKINITIARDGQVIMCGEGNPSVEVLTAGGGSEATLDSGGIVLRAEDGNVSFLLTADITAETELTLLTERAQLDSTVLKVAHHGSYTATSSEFLAVVTPQVAVISVGAENDYGHPSREVLTRLESAIGGANILRTDQDGTIEFITDGERLWLKKDR